MGRKTFWATVILTPVVLSGCAGVELQKSRDMAPTDAYSSALYQNYMERSQHEYDYGDYASSDIFARKARLAASGQRVPVFVPNGDGFPAGRVPESELQAMMQGRQALADVMTDNAARLAPQDLAIAQVSYDCWVEEESYIRSVSEASQPDHAAACRDAFQRALGNVQVAMRPAPQQTAQAPQPAPPPQTVPGSYMVFFAWDSSQISNEAREVIRLARENAEKAGARKLTVTGYTDTSGGSDYNMQLSERRAEAVEGVFSQMGVSKEGIAADWLGEQNPLVPTNDGVREPQNRRVEITLGR